MDYLKYIETNYDKLSRFNYEQECLLNMLSPEQFSKIKHIIHEISNRENRNYDYHVYDYVNNRAKVRLTSDSATVDFIVPLDESEDYISDFIDKTITRRMT